MNNLLPWLVLIAVIVAIACGLSAVAPIARTIEKLLMENKELKRSIERLTAEERIGYAKVVSQETVDGKTVTTLRFAETARDNPLKVILSKDYTIVGDVVHFDALVVKFATPLVEKGQERSLYLWRRVYGEYMAPGDGYPVETFGATPERYRELFDKLHVDEKKLFWEEIWSLSNNPDKLAGYGIQAVYGNAVYHRLKKGVVYEFNITNTGQIFAKTSPEI